MMKLWTAAALLGLATASDCGPSPTTRHAPMSTSASASGPAQAATEAATPAALFLNRAAMFETFEIQAARIAQASAQSQAVKDYAASAVAEHQATLQQLSGAAQAAGMPTPNPGLDEDYNAYLDMLHHASPQSFDTTYAAQQTIVSMSASGLYDSFTSTAPDSPLRQWAQTQSQHVHDSIDAARHLAAASAPH